MIHLSIATRSLIIAEGLFLCFILRSDTALFTYTIFAYCRGPAESFRTSPKSPPLSPPDFVRSSFPSLHQTGATSWKERDTTLTAATLHHSEEGKMEHRDTDFNILLATDSYKVPRRGRPLGWSGNEKWIKSQGGFITSQGHRTDWVLSCNTGYLRGFTAGRTGGGGGGYSEDGVPFSHSITRCSHRGITAGFNGKPAVIPRFTVTDQLAELAS